MSGVFKSIGKVFKKVVKVIKKVAIPALMIGAVVLTGGAALGVLPAVGTVLGGLGLSAGVTSILTGAAISGAMGAGIGGLTALATGKNVLKGATTGFIGGAISGGVLGAVSPTTVAGLNSFVGGKAVASAAGAAAGGGAPISQGLLASAHESLLPAVGAPTASLGSIGANGAVTATLGQAAPISSGLLSSATTSLVPAISPSSLAASVGGVPGATAGGSGIGGILAQNAGSLINTAGSAIAGLGKGKELEAQARADAASRRIAYDRAAYNYGYRNEYARDRKGNVIEGSLPTSQSSFWNYTNPGIMQPSFNGSTAGQQTNAPGVAPYYQIVDGKVVLATPGGA